MAVTPLYCFVMGSVLIINQFLNINENLHTKTCVVLRKYSAFNRHRDQMPYYERSDTWMLYYDDLALGFMNHIAEH